MSNTILTHYAKKLELHKKADRFLAEIIKESGFATEKEIWRGLILGDKKKAGSVIYAGKYQGKPAVLKIQHLKPTVNEPEIIRKFYQNSRSKKIFVPRVYFTRPWNGKRGYGYFISERVEGKNVFNQQFSFLPLDEGRVGRGVEKDNHLFTNTTPYSPPQPRRGQEKEFCRVYEDYKTNIKTKLGWWPRRAEEKNAVIFNFKRLESWLRIVKAAKLLKPAFYQLKVELYKKIIKKYALKQPMEFTHGHLSAHDIIKTKSGKYYLMSNFLWSYRPKWYDLAFNLWVNINDLPEMSYNELDDYIGGWLAAYERMTAVKKDKKFDLYFQLNLLERALGSILVDFGSVKYPAEKRKMAKVNFERWGYVFGKTAEKFKL